MDSQSKNLPWFEVVPNISEARSVEKVQHLIKVFQEIPGVYLLEAKGDVDHNRTVFTLIGLGEALEEGLFLMIQKSLEILDIQSHTGVHPRLGVVDVVPWIPFQNATMKEAIDFSEKLAKRVGETLKIPVYLYGESAKTPHRYHLADLRRGGLEKYCQNIGNDPTLAPDFGPSRVHPKGGVVIIGARDYLIAYNILLQSKDLKKAKSMSRRVRKMEGIKALAFPLPSQEKVQVSMNIVDFRKISIPQVFAMVENLAKEKGIQIDQSELIGLMPAEALVEDFKERYKIQNLEPNKILEVALVQKLAKSNPLDGMANYIQALSAPSSTPGGGSAAGATASIGSSLLLMALKLGKKKKLLPDLSSRIDKLLERWNGLPQRFLSLAKEDEKAYQRVTQKGQTALEKEQAFLEAARIPQNLANLIFLTCQEAFSVIEGIKKSLLPDFFSALWILQGAFFSALSMVKCNLPYIKEKESLENEIQDLERQWLNLWQDIQKKNPFLGFSC